LTDYGTRREWELLHKLAKKEIEQGLDVGAARIWPALVNCGKARTSFFGIPSLALALSRTRISGCRSLEGVGSQPFSYADTAAEKLQMLTKEDFGYLPGGSPEERAAAIRRAQQWWDDEGSKRYTFDRIEALLRETANQSLHGTP